MKIDWRLDSILKGVLVVSTLTVGVLLWQRFSDQGVSPSAVRTRQFAPPMRSSSDSTVSWTELTATYLGSQDCPVCTDEEFKRTLREVMGWLKDEAAGRDVYIRTVGVDLAGPMAEADAFLESSGDWDEVSIGSGWMNSMIREHSWEAGVTLVTPQVVLKFARISRSPSGEYMSESIGRPIYFGGGDQIAGLRDSPILSVRW